MKRWLFTLVFAMLVAGIAMADNKTISQDRLPEKAKQFLKQHFADHKVVFASRDDDFDDRDYEVMLENGTKIDFSASGEWQEVDAERGSVPNSVLPAGIVNYLKKNFADSTVVSIERERRGWEVKLSNDLELTFDRQYRLIDIDD